MIGSTVICIDKMKSIKKTAKKVVIWLIIKKKFRYLHLNFLGRISDNEIRSKKCRKN